MRAATAGFESVDASLATGCTAPKGSCVVLREITHASSGEKMLSRLLSKVARWVLVGQSWQLLANSAGGRGERIHPPITRSLLF
ncbi:MAG: hypothetical protein DWH97_12530 [Planctomycetota bacterium]|nr:MAG: hypothetical protein DWH97_12530 [Planctomycetota bacterium]RLS95543.1 MAG: hypothetical protein DWI12_04400 [Planctomycetota bacterium]